jgi:hypothetical protein
MTIAPDGSPIDLYLRLPSFGEGERIHKLRRVYTPLHSSCVSSSAV